MQILGVYVPFPEALKEISLLFSMGVILLFIVLTAIDSYRVLFDRKPHRKK